MRISTWFRQSGFVLLLLISAMPAQAAPRVALLIGNAAYDAGLSPLTNPPNDVRHLERALKKLNFQVEAITNADLKAMQRAVRGFGNQARNAEVAFFYYSGHGIQSKGENYLLPVKAQIDKEVDLPIEAVGTSWLMQQLEEAGAKVSVVVLDACRDNPIAGRTKSAGKGLARVEAPSRTLIPCAFATNSTVRCKFTS